MSEEDSGNSVSCVISDGVGLGKLGVMFYNEKEADVAVFVGRSDSDMVDADGSCVVHDGLCQRCVRKRLGRAAVLLTLRAL